jgi:putative transposase
MDDKRNWIEANHPWLSIRKQCEILEVSRSNIYYTPHTQNFSDKQLALLRLVDEIYTRHPFFGTRQMSDYISLHHYPCKRHQTRWAYEQLGLHSLAPGPGTSKPHPAHKVYPYLLQEFKVEHPNQVFSTDITYIRLEGGFVYLMAIIDWHSRYVLDWQLSVTMEADFCVETLKSVLESSSCEIFNTDQGSQFTSKEFTDVLKEHGIKRVHGCFERARHKNQYGWQRALGR